MHVSRRALFHMKTTVFLKYFVRDCRPYELSLKYTTVIESYLNKKMKKANANNNSNALELLRHIARLNTWLSPLECFRNSYSEVFIKKGAFKICSKFRGKPPYRSVISINLQNNFIEITLHHGCSPVNLLNIFRTLLLKTSLDGCFWIFALMICSSYSQSVVCVTMWMIIRLYMLMKELPT